MLITGLLHKILVALGFGRRVPDQTMAGLVAAVVSFDREDLTVSRIGQSDEEEILARQRVTVERRADGKLDGADWSASRIQWLFFGKDAKTLETVLLEALRQEPRCKGALLRVTCNGIAGPWRETRI